MPVGSQRQVRAAPQRSRSSRVPITTTGSGMPTQSSKLSRWAPEQRAEGARQPVRSKGNASPGKEECMYHDTAIVAVPAGITGTSAALFAPVQVALGLGVVAALIAARVLLMVMRSRRLADQ